MPGSDVAGLRQQLLAAKRAEREAQQRERVADAFMAAVGEAVDCDIPESLLSELGAQQYRCGTAAGGVQRQGSGGRGLREQDRCRGGSDAALVCASARATLRCSPAQMSNLTCLPTAPAAASP